MDPSGHDVLDSCTDRLHAEMQSLYNSDPILHLVYSVLHSSCSVNLFSLASFWS
jgi:hypothetical protein